MLGGFAGGYAPFVWLRRRNEQVKRERERAWPAALAQLADALEAGLAFPAAVALLGETGPIPLRAEFARMHARLRSDGLAAALDQLAATRERTAGTVALLLRAGLVELPAGGLAPLLRELSVMLSDRFEAREKARTKASSLQLEAAILALSPIVLLLLVGAASPTYLAAYKTGAGTAVGDRWRDRDLRLLPADAPPRPHPGTTTKRGAAVNVTLLLSSLCLIAGGLLIAVHLLAPQRAPVAERLTSVRRSRDASLNGGRPANSGLPFLLGLRAMLRARSPPYRR